MGRPTTEEQKWAMWIHGSAAFGFVLPFANVWLPYFIWRAKRKAYPALDAHGKAVLNFQLSMTIYFLVSMLLLFLWVGIFFLIALSVFQALCIFLAVLEAHDLDVFRYRFSIDMV